MKFEHLCNLLFEAKNIKYNVPKDKEQLLYDFYFLTALQSLPSKSQLDLDVKLQASLDDAVEKIVNYLYKEFLDIVLFAIASEFKHVEDVNFKTHTLQYFQKLGLGKFYETYQKLFFDKFFENEPPEEEKKEFSDYYTKRKHELNFNKIYDKASFFALKKAIKKSGKKDVDVVRGIARSFVELSWEEYYGGSSWAKIAEGWIRLKEAKSLNDKIIAIDHIYDLQHNTGSVFEKILSYYKENKGFDWILDALNFKKNIKNLWELFDKISTSAKTLGGYVLKEKGYGDLNSF